MIQEDYKDDVSLCMKKIKRVEAQLELNQAIAVKDSKKYFYKYRNSKKRTKENLHSLLDAGRNIDKG